MSETERLRTAWLSRISKAAGLLVAIVVLAALTLKLMYSTQLGFVVADAIPNAVWTALEAAHGPADGESAQDVEALALAAVSVVIAIVVVSACVLLLRLRRRSEA